MISETRRKYREEFGDSIPSLYFRDNEAALDAAKDALDRGKPFTHREWLQRAGYDAETIQGILDGDILI